MRKNLFLGKALSVFFIFILITSTIPGLEENLTKETKENIEEIIEEPVKINEDLNQTINENNRKDKENEEKNLTTIKTENQTEGIEMNLTEETYNENKTESNSNENETIEEENKTTEIRSIKERSVITQNEENLTESEPIKLLEENQIEEETIVQEIKTHIFYDNGKKSYEIETNESIPEIEKIEKVEDKEKEIVISSEEHFESPLRVYSDLVEEAEKEKIKIYWENEDKEAKGIQYYDENENGLIERVSWIVPHLSTQIFKIIIETETFNSTDDSIDVISINQVSGQQKNPINFKFSVAYNQSESIECLLIIHNESETAYQRPSVDNDSIEYPDIILPDGEYGWTFRCWYDMNTSNYDFETGNFTIFENYRFESLQDIYLLKKWNNQLVEGNPQAIARGESGETSVRAYLEDSTGTKSQNFTNPSGGHVNVILMNSGIITNEDTYTLNAIFEGRTEEPTHISKQFSVGEINIDNLLEVEKSHSTEIEIEIDTTHTNKYISELIILFGDGHSDVSYFSQNVKNQDIEISHQYMTTGTFTPRVEFKIGDKFYNITSPKSITVLDGEDTEDPVIDLISPEDDEVIEDTTATFKFETSDNRKIDHCNFSIYNRTGNGYTESDKAYTEKINNIDNGERIEIELTDFDDREYAWEVECIDNSSNYEWDFRYFEIDTNSSTTTLNSNSEDIENIEYERKEEVKELMKKATEFIEKENLWSADAKKALEDLGILEDVKFFKKRLLDIEQTLAKNLGYIEDETLREERRVETLAELDEIKEKMPVEFRVRDTYEYVKNGNSLNWEEIIKEYLSETNTRLSNSISELVKENKELQQQIGVSTVLMDIEIEYYNDKTEELTLVKKELKFTNDSKQKILEVLPSKLIDKDTEIKFITDDVDEVIKNHIYELSSEDLKKGEIIYVIKEQIKLKDLEEIDTVLFTEKTDKKRMVNTISGFLILGSGTDEGINSTLLFLLLILVVVILFIWIFSMARKAAMKKDPNIYRILDLIEQIRKNLKENDITDARENYKKIQEQYKVLSEKSKSKVYSILKRALAAIDRKDIFGLVKEYEKAKSNFQKKEALEIYSEVKNIYKRLSKKDQTIIIKKLGL